MPAEPTRRSSRRASAPQFHPAPDSFDNTQGDNNASTSYNSPVVPKAKRGRKRNERKMTPKSEGGWTHWSEEETQLLIQLVEKHGTSNCAAKGYAWPIIQNELNQVWLERYGIESCRTAHGLQMRYYKLKSIAAVGLDPVNHIKKPWTEAEDAKVLAIKNKPNLNKVNYKAALPFFPGRAISELRTRRMLLEDGIRRKKEKEGLGFVSPKRKYNEPASPTHTVSLSLFLNDDMTFKSDDLSQSFYPSSSTSSKKRPRISSTSLPPQLSKYLDSDDEEDEGDDQEGIDVDQEEEEDEEKPDFQLSESLGGGVGGGGNGEEGDSEWVNVEE
ncbi:hypothetical protein JCM5350_003441 [Sporobolomyces pararoseus]